MSVPAQSRPARPAASVRDFVDELLSHYRDLYRHLTYQLRNVDDAADIAQTSFERAYATTLRSRKPQDEDADSSLRGLLFRIAHNLCIDEARRRKVAGNWLAERGALAAQLTAPSAEQVASQRQIAQRVADVLAGLPPRRMRAFILYRAYGHSRAEIAALLGISEAAVAKHLVRATLDCSHALRNLHIDLGPATAKPLPPAPTAAPDGDAY